VFVGGESKIKIPISIALNIAPGASIYLQGWTDFSTKVADIETTNGAPTGIVRISSPVLTNLLITEQLAEIVSGENSIIIKGANPELIELINTGVESIYVTGTELNNGTAFDPFTSPFVPTNFVKIDNIVEDVSSTEENPRLKLTLTNGVATGTNPEGLVKFHRYLTLPTNLDLGLTLQFTPAELLNSIGIAEASLTTGETAIKIAELKNETTGELKRISNNNEILGTDVQSINLIRNNSVFRVANQLIYNLDKSSAISEVFPSSLVFRTSPSIANASFTNIPFININGEEVQTSGDPVNISFNRILRRSQSLPLLNKVYWNSIPFSLLLGGESYYQGLFKYLSLAGFKKALDKRLPNVSFTTYRAGAKTQNEFYIEIEEPVTVEKLKIPTLTPITLSLSTSQNENQSSIVAYSAQEAFIQNSSSVLRHNSTYSPIFREVSAFYPKISIGNSDTIVNANCKFNPNANRFFDVKNFEHIKVSNQKILELEGSDKYEPTFTLINETPISSADLYLLASDWDFGFHKLYTNKNTYVNTYGTRRIEEDTYFMSKLSSIPDLIELDAISAQRDSIRLRSVNSNAVRPADIIYTSTRTLADLDVDLTNSAIAKILDSSKNLSSDIISSANLIKGNTKIELLTQNYSSLSPGMLVKASGISQYTQILSISNNLVTLSRPIVQDSIGPIEVRFTKKSGLYYTLLENFGILPDQVEPELLGELDFTTYAKQYALKNIVPNYEIEKIDVWFAEEKSRTPGILVQSLTAEERYNLGYDLLPGAQINIKKGPIAQIRIPLKATGRLLVNIETKMRFI
jgi:hypothetical protein